jgi:toxin CcdB
MARLDVHRAPGRNAVGYVVDVQADLLAGLTTRMVIPLIPEAAVRSVAAGLNPVFEIEGKRHVLATQAMAAVPRREPRGTVTSLKRHQDAILAAMDLLVTGF